MKTIQNINELKITGGNKMATCNFLGTLTLALAMTTFGTAALFSGTAYIGYCLD